MPMPVRQSLRVGAYILAQRLRRRERFPLLVELEPLFACNLKCAGCGKIQHPAGVLKQRMPVEQAVAAVEECGAPMVSIAGGEPLMHPQIGEMVEGVRRLRGGRSTGRPVRGGAARTGPRPRPCTGRHRTLGRST